MPEKNRIKANRLNVKGVAANIIFFSEDLFIPTNAQKNEKVVESNNVIKT